MVPKELQLIGIYMPPIFVVSVLALSLAWATAWGLNRYRLSRFFVNPPLVFIAIVTLYAMFIGTFIIRI